VLSVQNTGPSDDVRDAPVDLQEFPPASYLPPNESNRDEKGKTPAPALPPPVRHSTSWNFNCRFASPLAKAFFDITWISFPCGLGLLVWVAAYVAWVFFDRSPPFFGTPAPDLPATAPGLELSQADLIYAIGGRYPKPAAQRRVVSAVVGNLRHAPPAVNNPNLGRVIAPRQPPSHSCSKDCTTTSVENLLLDWV
jgi:hypothetical protein